MDGDNCESFCSFTGAERFLTAHSVKIELPYRSRRHFIFGKGANALGNPWYDTSLGRLMLNSEITILIICSLDSTLRLPLALASALCFSRENFKSIKKNIPPFRSSIVP